MSRMNLLVFANRYHRGPASFLFSKPKLSFLHHYPKRYRFITTMPSNEASESAIRKVPFKVLVIGGSYAGLAATVNLLDLCHGRPPRFNRDVLPDVAATGQKVPLQITIVDERDGYCMCGPHFQNLNSQ